MKTKVTLAIVAAVLILWVIFPDPVVLVIDDIVAGIAAAATLLALIVSFVNKNKQ